MVAAAVIGSAVVGGAVSAYSANKAAKQQAQSGQQSIAAQKAMFDTVRGDLMPYQDLGKVGIGGLTSKLGYLTDQFTPDQAWLEATPGYKFALSQGLKSVQNSASARGLGISGAAQKGAASFATGLADQTWRTQFDADQAQKGNIYNKLMGLVQSGQNAAAQTGSYGTQTAQSIGQTLQGIGNAQAAGTVGVGNAVSGIAGAAGNAYLMSRLLGGGGGAPGGGGIYGPGV